MANLFQVSIVTQDSTLFEGSASSLIAPAVQGYLGVLAMHAPLIAQLVPGKIILKNDSGNTTIIDSAGKGFMEVSKNKASLILDSVKQHS